MESRSLQEWNLYFLNVPRLVPKFYRPHQRVSIRRAQRLCEQYAYLTILSLQNIRERSCSDDAPLYMTCFPILIPRLPRRFSLDLMSLCSPPPPSHCFVFYEPQGHNTKASAP